MTFDSPLRILLVEDDDEDALILMNLMRATQEVTWQVTRVGLLEHAVRELRNHRFDVVLLDLSLPDSRGHETVMSVEHSAPMTAVVVLTGLDDDFMAEESIRQGAQDYLIKGQTDARLITRSVRYAIERKKSQGRLLELALQLEQSNAKLRELVATDPLTNLPNRRHFEQELARVWANSARDGRPLALLMADLDDFRSFDESRGFLEGDATLQKVADVLRRGTGRPGEVAARYGGEDFAVLLPAATGDDARAYAERVRSAVTALGVKVSIGVAAVVPSADDAPAALVARAERALRAAKAGGRDRVSLAE